MKSVSNYYTGQLKKVSETAPEFPRQIQIRGTGKQTNWLSLNDDSANHIVKWLKEHYNIKE